MNSSRSSRQISVSCKVYLNCTLKVLMVVFLEFSLCLCGALDVSQRRVNWQVTCPESFSCWKAIDLLLDYSLQRLWCTSDQNNC